MNKIITRIISIVLYIVSAFLLIKYSDQGTKIDAGILFAVAAINLDTTKR